MFDSIASILVCICNDTFPYVTRKIKPLDILKLHITSELRDLIQEKHRLEKNVKRHPIIYGNNTGIYETE